MSRRRRRRNISCHPTFSCLSYYYCSLENKTSIHFDATRWMSTAEDSTVKSTTTTTTDVRAAVVPEGEEESDSSSSSSSCWIEEVRLLLRQNSPRQAQNVLYQAEQNQQIISCEQQDKREMAEQIIDSWIQYQDELLEAYYHTYDSSSSSSSSNNDDDYKKKNDTDHHHLLRQRRGQLKGICEAAEQAHLMLEVMLPFLSRNNSSTSLQPYTNVVVKTATTTTRHKSLEDDAAAAATAKVQRSLLSHRKFDVGATAKCDAVLAAYAKAARAGHCIPNTRLTRAIPQRAQHLLEQMEALYSSDQQQVSAVTTTNHNKKKKNENDKEKWIVVRPSVESYNRVMEAWTYSHEHLRGSMAERIFKQLSERTASGSRPNGESFKLIIWAWALSGERRDAFTATGHLMKMLRKLDKGDEDMEPSLEDYKVIFKAWTKAE